MSHSSPQQQLRIDILGKYIEGDIHLLDALSLIEVKERQFRRLLKRFRELGPVGLLHGNKGRTPTNKTSQSTRYSIEKIYRQKYYDLSVRHFIEKLHEIEQWEHIPSYTTVRSILLKANLISRKNKRPRKSHRRRKRYAKEGLMIQIDGSHHHWIPGHKPFCLTAAIDDATGKIVGAKFTKTETTFAAMDVVKQVIKTKGRFHMLYSDKAGIYGGGKRQNYSQMEGALRQLDIVALQANSPQAKGRVERLFGTLQNRLVQEMRLAGVKSIEQANEFLEGYLEVFNKKFGVEPESKESAYRPLAFDTKLNEIFCMREHRSIKNGNVFNFGGHTYVVESEEFLSRKTVEIRFYPNGQTSFFINQQQVNVSRINEVRVAA